MVFSSRFFLCSSCTDLTVSVCFRWIPLMWSNICHLAAAVTASRPQTFFSSGLCSRHMLYCEIVPMNDTRRRPVEIPPSPPKHGGTPRFHPVGLWSPLPSLWFDLLKYRINCTVLFWSCMSASGLNPAAFPKSGPYRTGPECCVCSA